MFSKTSDEKKDSMFSINGIITDENLEPLSKASCVLIRLDTTFLSSKAEIDINESTFSDFNGNFMISKTNHDAYVLFSAIGYMDTILHIMEIQNHGLIKMKPIKNETSLDI